MFKAALYSERITQFIKPKWHNFRMNNLIDKPKTAVLGFAS